MRMRISLSARDIDEGLCGSVLWRVVSRASLFGA